MPFMLLNQVIKALKDNNIKMPTEKICISLDSFQTDCLT